MLWLRDDLSLAEKRRLSYRETTSLLSRNDVSLKELMFLSHVSFYFSI